jgi:hypothetical protein
MLANVLAESRSVTTSRLSESNEDKNSLHGSSDSCKDRASGISAVGNLVPVKTPGSHKNQHGFALTS